MPVEIDSSVHMLKEKPHPNFNEVVLHAALG